MRRSDQWTPLTVVHKGRVVDAIYRKPEISDFKGNPLIEALPPALTPEQALSLLAFYPAYDEAHRKAPEHIRKLYIQNGMRFFAPLDIHVDLAHRFSCLLRMGYLSRNPLDNIFWAKAASNIDSLRQSISQYGDWSGDSSWTASGFSIVGMSGIGKSRSVLRILNLYPQVIRHSHYQNRDFTYSQLVWLKIECPFDGNPRGLCIEFFKVVDSILGTTYHEDYVRSRRLQDELLSDMATVASNHCLGVLVIDEIQRLSLSRSGGADKMLNFFVKLINTIGVPVVLIGTYKAMSVLSGEFSQMRRGTGQGDLIWDRMSNDEQWALLLESLWRFQYTKKKCPLTPELSNTLYEETQGITDFAVKAYMFSQERAVDSQKEVITPAVIRSVTKDKLGLPRAVLNALKLGDKRILERFEDVYPTALKNYLAEIPETSQTSCKPESVPDAKTTVQEFFKKPPTQQVTSLHLNNSPDQDRNCSNEASVPNSEHINQSKRGIRHTSPKGELPKVVATTESKGALAAYEALKQAGYIRSGTEFLHLGE